MKRLIRWFLILAMCMAMLPTTALAVDESRSYTFDLTVNGSNEVYVMPGDIITVTFTLRRNDSADAYTMYAVQNEIRYDDEFVRPVENGSIVNASIETRDIALRGGDRAFYMNYVSFADGMTWNANQIVGTFQLEILGNAGVTVMKNENYVVSLRDGSDSYLADANDLTLIVSADCIVSFETNGGSEMESIAVPYGELMERPDDPVRDGYHLEGWYSDLDLLNAWDFETMPVESNMTLYAKWAEGEPESNWWQKIVDWFKDLFDGFDLGGIGAWLSGAAAALSGMGGLIGAIAAGLLLLFLLILLLRRKRKVIFETNGGAPIAPIKVKRNQTLKNLPVPVRGYSVFCGWYKDEQLTDPWYADVDKIKKRKTKLYAKWL